MKNTIEQTVDMNLAAGEIIITNKPGVIKTVLGSCTSLVLYHAKTKTIAISHAQLPNENFETHCHEDCPVKCNRHSQNRFKYVTCSTRHMLSRFEELGIKKNEITVKLFGGANVIGEYTRDNVTIGEKNISALLSMLKEYGLRATKKDLGGKLGRTLYLKTETGDVFVRKHARINTSTPKAGG